MTKEAGKNVDISEAPSTARPSRAEIEQALDLEVEAILELESKCEAVPGWSLLAQMETEVEFLDGDPTKPIPAISETRAEELVELAKRDQTAFDLATYIAGMRVLAELHMPVPLRNFAADVIMGESNRPTRRGRPHSQSADIQIHQYNLCVVLKAKVPMKLTRNPKSKNFTACDAVAEAFTRAKRHTTYEQLESLCCDKNYADRRELAKFLGLLNFQDFESMSASKK